MITELVAKPTILKKDQIISLVKKIASLSGGDMPNRDREQKCWKYYNNQIDESEFDYLTKIGDYELPSRIRHIPNQRHLLNLLSSQQIMRGFQMSVIGIDERSTKNRYNRGIKLFMDELARNLELMSADYITKQQQLEQKLNEFSEIMQMQPESEDQAKMIQQARIAYPQLSMQLNMLKSQYSKQQAITDDKIEELERKSKYDNKDMDEEFAQKVLMKLRQVLNIEQKSNENFISHTVIGKQFYYVDYYEGHRHPIYETLDEATVRFPLIPSIKYVQDGPWAAIVDMLSFDQVQSMYGPEIIKEYGESKLAEIGSIYGYSENGGYVSMPDNTAPYYPTGMNYGGVVDSNNNIKRTRVFVKVPRIIRVKRSRNPYMDGKYYRHYIDSEKYLLNKDDFNYKNGVYISKDKKSSYSSKMVDTFSKKNGDEIETRVITDVYEATMLNPDIIINYRKKDFIVSDIDDYSVTKLPIIGKTHSSNTDAPYSLIEATMGLQDSYNLLYYYRDLMLALSGSKGNVIDMSQKPLGMSQEEWEYQIKMGRLYVQTVDSTGKRVINTAFNQWQNFDNTLSASVQYINNMILQVEDTMGNIIGVPRPRQGQVVNTDQVGTFDKSIQQSSLITEIIYNDHDEIERMAISQLLNLSCRYIYNKEQVLSVSTTDGGIDTIKLPNGIFSESYFDVLLGNNTKEETMSKELKQIVFQNYKAGITPFSDFVDIYATDSLTEIKNKAIYFAKKQDELRSQMAQSNMESQLEFEKKKIEFQNEMEKYALDLKNNIERMKIDFDKASLLFKQQELQAELAYKYSEDKNKTDMKMLEIKSEREIEGAYLVNQDKHSLIQEKLKAVEIQLNAIQSGMQAMQNKEDSDKSHKEKMTKVMSDHIAKTSKKENIKD